MLMVPICAPWPRSSAVHTARFGLSYLAVLASKQGRCTVCRFAVVPCFTAV
jgi:hypothetical protein